ncbi:helix-turn-helix transcriptional regulator [Dolichospermum heterosporum]|uniref:WYL domain-containing protein n=1 Tax=Dolichospermum heterosporum TAC447 TaxID=747523 RepID=A0ABY5LY49_9CYAN|nr:WYL domain-containing protein [Dolichospermum heterosporum]UUO15801.1 WYL domain-containing protein [Dolichospermum heterosporum TAC447]
MSSKNDNNSNQLGFMLELLKLLAEKPCKKAELEILLSDRGFEAGDLSQKIARAIGKLRDCGFEIKAAPNRPYELVTSVFPVILSEEQRQALAMASELLASLGFSAEAGHIHRIGNFQKPKSPGLRTDFHPPTDYSEDKINEVVRQLQQRFQQKRRFVVWYRSRKGKETFWDLDKSELRLHNSVLYLFALVPDFRSSHLETRPNAEQNITLRVDRITRVGGVSQTPWTYSKFPTLDITYRLTGDLASYRPRRPHETVISSLETTEYVDILTQEDCIFWFRQRMLQYGVSARVLNPDWVAKGVKDALKKAYDNYCVE